MQAPLKHHDVVTAIPTRDPETVRGDIRKQVYAHHQPPTTRPSCLDKLKDREIDGTDSATRYDIATAGWEPEPRYTAVQDNIDTTQLADELDTPSAQLSGTAFNTDGRPFVGYLPPAASRKYIGTSTTPLAGVLTDLHPSQPPESGLTVIRLAEPHVGLPDPDPVDLVDAAPASGVPDDEAGWLSLLLITAAWCPVPAPDPGFLQLHPGSDNDIAAKRTESPAAVHLHSPTPTRRTMRFTADVDDTATDRFRSLEADRVPIPAIHQRDDGDWYVTAAHLETVISELLADGMSVCVTPVIEARDLPADVRPADAPTLPWHID
jgi:hypothetical protein